MTNRDACLTNLHIRTSVSLVQNGTNGNKTTRASEKLAFLTMIMGPASMIVKTTLMIVGQASMPVHYITNTGSLLRNNISLREVKIWLNYDIL